jgi:hypothetical protein
VRHEFAKINFKQSESVEEFSLRITTLENEMRVLGDEITDKEVVKKLLHSVLEKLEQVSISMETLLDQNSLSIEEASGHLRAVLQRKKTTASPAMNAGEWLLLIEEAWTTRMKTKEKGGSSGSGGRNRGRGQGRGRGGGHGGNGGNGGDSNSNPQDGHEGGGGRGACHNCGKMGHWARECRSKAKKVEAHAA